jgi:glycosyltransferase involved in cell wall biosynthesis
MKKILILANHFVTIYAFRRELVEELVRCGNEVYLGFPMNEDTDFFLKMGCKVIDTPLDRRGTNPISDAKLLLQYLAIIREVEPDMILTYTIKPNIYGGIAARICRIKVMHTVTGLGSVYIQNMWHRKVIAKLNRIAFRSAAKVVFLNEDNQEFYKRLGIITEENEAMIVPGSGVNLDYFKYREPSNNGKTTFTFVARILKDKGIEEFLGASKELSQLYKNVEFQVVGFIDDNKYIDLLRQLEQEGIIRYLGKRDDIPNVMAESDCIVLPSYGEGRGTVLQEGAATGRPLITCDTYGCRENVEDGYNGYLCKSGDTKSLTNSVCAIRVEL